MVTEILQPLIPQARVTDLKVRVARSGLTMGDAASLQPAEEGRIAVFAITKTPFLFLTLRKNRLLGYLNEADSAVVLPRLVAGDVLRVRIVGLTPEHLGQDGLASLQLSIWGHQPYVRQEAKRADPPVRLTVPPLRKKTS